MISEISIKNFKSIEELTLPLGRVTVLIGENGSGKSNMLEALAMLGAATAEKLDQEFLVSRGVRNTPPRNCLALFEAAKPKDEEAWEHKLWAKLSDMWIGYRITLHEVVPDQIAWWARPLLPVSFYEELLRNGDPDAKDFDKVRADMSSKSEVRVEDKLRLFFPHAEKGAPTLFEWLLNLTPQSLPLRSFVIFSPEYAKLRRFEDEQQIHPLGVNGEGLFALLQRKPRRGESTLLKRVAECMCVLQWFDGLQIPDDLGAGEKRLQLRDRFVKQKQWLDQRSANEGFLFLLFYFTLFLSKETPAFFAIDNIDASLNPRLSAELMRQLVKLAKENGKQVILTTHNPGLLDGLDLNDPEQKLYAVSRNETGRTVARAVPAPVPLKKGDLPVKLSHAFLQGVLGGVPKNF